MGKHYNDEFKYKVLSDYLNNQGGVRILAKKYNVPYQTIDWWVIKYRKQGNLTNENISIELIMMKNIFQKMIQLKY